MNPQTRETISKIVSEDNAQDKIIVLGARVNNLKNIDVVVPRNSLTVITGSVVERVPWLSIQYMQKGKEDT